jgi:isoquinoline 1-oxidoreductase subunit alpha
MTKLTVNGTAVEYDGDPSMPLLWYLRDVRGLTGTKFGCGIAQCGACTVHLNGEPRRSCVTPMSMLNGADIITIEGAKDKVTDAVRASWLALDVPQCGYCQSGQIMSAVGMLSTIPKMTGNVCRCCTYHRIRAAIHDAAQRLEG